MRTEQFEEITKAIGQLLDAYEPQNKGIEANGARIAMFILQVLDAVSVEVRRQHGTDYEEMYDAIISWLELRYGLEGVIEAIQEKAEEYGVA